MFDHAFEFAPIGMTIVGPKGAFWKVNRAFSNFIGYSAEELSNMNVFDVTYSEDHQATVTGRENLLTGDALVNQEEKRYVRKDGNIVWGLMTRSIAYSLDKEIKYTLGHIQDITELKKTQETLLESEERYARAISGTADGLWEVNLQTGENFKSPRWKSMLGYADDEIGNSTESFLSLLHPEDVTIAEEALQERLQTQGPVDYTIRMRHKDAHYVDIQSRGQVFNDDKGAPLYISGTHTDITQKLSAAKELETVRKQLVDAIESLSDAFAIYDAEDKLVICNEKYREFYQRSGDQIKPGMTFEELMRNSVKRGLHKEAFGREEEWIQERLERHHNPQRPTEQELNDGRWLRVEERKTSDGGTVGFRVDITNLKLREKALLESEERYRSLIETSPDGVVVVSSTQEILYANQQAAVLYGFENPESLIGIQFKNFVHPDDIESAMDFRAQRKKVGRHPSFQLRHKTIEGHIFDAEVAAVSIPWNGEESGLLFIRDISELKKVNRLKDEFVSTVSHELRTPLTSIKGALGLLRSETLGELPEQAKTMIDIAYSNSERLVLLINDLLDIQKFEAGKIGLNLEKLEPTILLEKSIKENKGFSDEYKISFILKKTVPDIFVKADEGRIMQVLSNLLSNAAKFSFEGDTVELSVEKHDGHVLISVIDQGCGIAKENHDQVFKKFVQVDSTDTRQKGGTGLGLNISQTIVEQHGGSIGFDSEIDKGSTFYFKLPLFDG